MIRFQVADILNKGFRAYEYPNFIHNRDRELYSKVLYNRYFLETFYIGNILFVKNRRRDED